MNDLDKQIEEVQKEYNALGWKLHLLKRQKAKEDKAYEQTHAKELGFADVGDYHSYARGVEMGYWDWHGNVNLQKHGNVAVICRKEPEWSKVIPGFMRNLYLALLFDQWNKTALSKDDLLKPGHGDYDAFFKKGYGPLTDKEIAIIQAGDDSHHHGGLTFG